MAKPVLEFWFDFASTYSYLSAMRIETLADDAGVEVVWRPFLLGPIFKAQGWTSSPFNIYPAKGRYMIRDMRRLAAERGLPFRMPDPFPQNSIAAARLSCAIENEKFRAEFAKSVFRAEFQNGDDISQPGALEPRLRDAAAACGLDVDIAHLFSISKSDPIKDILRRQTDTAAGAGIFGAPTFKAGDGEIFWGDDRLPQALIWASSL